MSRLNRRSFLKTSAVSFGATFLGSSTVAADEDRAECFTVQYRTNRYKPPASLSLLVSAADETREAVFIGDYVENRWVFLVPSDQFNGKAHVVFLLDGDRNEGQVPIEVDVQHGQSVEYDFRDFKLSLLDELASSRSPLSEKLFKEADSRQDYDVVVVGSGMGGGVVADQLADAGLDVLVLEAGSLIFPTHIGNLPRSHKIGLFNKHIWDLYYRFATQYYKNSEGSEYVGAQGYNLGGRSIFWGAFIPRMTQWELEYWPVEIKSYLLTDGYSLAEDLLNKTDLESAYQTQAKDFLREKLSEFTVKDAPVAIEHTSVSTRLIPMGVFSTADLLVESALTEHPVGNDNLTLRLRHPAVRINHSSNKVTSITALDLDRDEFREYRGRYFLLCAGSVESAKLAQYSNLKPADIIGRGLTAHPIYYTHFGVPRDHDLFRDAEAAKVLLQHPDANSQHHPYNILFEFGADLNHGRYVDPDIFGAHQKEKDHMLCEVVFLANALLNDENYIKASAGKFYAKPEILVRHTKEAVLYREQVEEMQQRILKLFDARVLPNDNLKANLAGAGGVAHEVGTLRMGTNQNNASVVDENLKFHHYENLWACDMSILPTSPAANPSLTLVALALRLARHIASIDA